MLNDAIEIAFVLIGTAQALNLYRLLRGPDTTDRILALDTLGINTIALLVLFGIRSASSVYFEGRPAARTAWASSVPLPCASFSCGETSSNEQQHRSRRRGADRPRRAVRPARLDRTRASAPIS
jgi:multisubunit Na+/H+ antiporter MnhF subunit